MKDNRNVRHPTRRTRLGRAQARPRDRQDRPPGRRRRPRHLRRDHGARHRRRRQGAASAGIDFFPLTVNYQEKTFAAGRIPGGYFKREGRPTEKETLVSRLIDRPIRPLFADGFRNETQVIVTALSHDLENDPDIVAMVAASAALTLSGVPFMGPIGAARVGFINGEYVLNPPLDEMAESQLDLVVAGTADAVLMVESEAKELTEDVMLGAVMFGHRHFQPVIEAIIQLAEKAAKEPRDLDVADNSALEKAMLDLVEADLRAAYTITDKPERHNAVDAAKAKVMAALFPDGAENPVFDKQQVGGVFKELEAKIVRWNILDTGKRIDGRDVKTVRPIVAEVGVLPRTHGSALFTRGETQALVVATLGTGEDEQYDRRAGGDLQGNLPAALQLPALSRSARPAAWARPAAARSATASSPGAPSVRCCRRITSSPTRSASSPRSPSSNGSSSMATVCGSSLALMDAGVPLKRPVAGIAMGLILEGERFAVLSDILGDEDHLGDMDFKVAGTENGVTSLQMDIKIAGITEEIMRVALDQAKDGRLHILGEMTKALTAARAELGEHRAAHRDDQDPDRQDPRSDRHGRQGDPRDRREDRRQDRHQRRRHRQDRLRQRQGDQGGDQLDQVDRLRAGGRHDLRGHGGQDDRLRRLRELLRRQGRPRPHLAARASAASHKITDVVKEGDKVKVKLLGFDERGKVRLSMKVVDQETGEDLEASRRPRASRAAASSRARPRRRRVDCSSEPHHFARVAYSERTPIASFLSAKCLSGRPATLQVAPVVRNTTKCDSGEIDTSYHHDRQELAATTGNPI